MKLEELKVADIKQPQNALRAAQTTTEDYQGLKRSIAQNGVKQSINVRPCPDEPGKYILINGLQRWTASQELGYETIPAIIEDANDLQARVLQIQLNKHTVKTKRAEYANTIRDLIISQPHKTEAQIAADLSVTVDWLRETLSLQNLSKDIQELVDEGKIVMATALKLAKLPIEEQATFSDRAIKQTAAEIVPALDERIKQIREAAKTGKAAKPAEFVPSASARSRADITAELATGEAASANITDGMSASEAWKAALKWTLQLDPATIDEKKSKWEADKKEAEAKKVARQKAQAEKKQQEEAAAAAAALT